MKEKIKIKSLSYEELIELEKLTNDFLKYLNDELIEVKKLEEDNS